MKDYIFESSSHAIGKMYIDTGRVREAINIYKNAIRYNPDDALVHRDLGFCYLSLGNFSEGWSEHEWRCMAMKFMPVPFWQGQSLKNKIIGVVREQGFGDTIQFVRYISLLKAEGATVVLGCHEPVRRLLSGTADVVVVEGTPNSSYNVHFQIPLMSLPHRFGTTLVTIPNQVPYLSVPPDAGQKAASIIKASSKYRVGLVWQGTTHRMLSLRHLVPLFNIPNIQFFSLQKGRCVQEIKILLPGKLINLDPYLDDFADTAAAMQDLDLVISIDSSPAHLAGALARPVWTLIPFPGEWRWMLNREDSPWYPTMRLFRQPKAGDWASVIKRVSEELKSLAGAK